MFHEVTQFLLPSRAQENAGVCIISVYRGIPPLTPHRLCWNFPVLGFLHVSWASKPTKQRLNCAVLQTNWPLYSLLISTLLASWHWRLSLPWSAMIGRGAMTMCSKLLEYVRVGCMGDIQACHWKLASICAASMAPCCLYESYMSYRGEAGHEVAPIWHLTSSIVWSIAIIIYNGQ